MNTNSGLVNTLLTRITNLINAEYVDGSHHPELQARNEGLDIALGIFREELTRESSPDEKAHSDMLAEELERLIDMMAEVPDGGDGQGDRVFAHYEFDDARAALAKHQQRRKEGDTKRESVIQEVIEKCPRCFGIYSRGDVSECQYCEGTGKVTRYTEIEDGAPV